MYIRGEIIFIYRILWNVFKADSDILWSVHWDGRVKFADFKSKKARMVAGEYAVDDKFGKFKRSCRCFNIPGVADSISYNGDLCSVGIFFVGSILAYHFGERDLVTAVVGDIFVSDNLECISSLNALLFGAFIALEDALA